MTVTSTVAATAVRFFNVIPLEVPAGMTMDLRRRPSEFLQVDVGDGLRFNAWMIKPPDFDASRRYPVFMCGIIQRSR